MDECIRCKEVGEDRRTLWMACLYEMDELEIPFGKIFSPPDYPLPNKFYVLSVCKKCRSDWMMAIKDWFNKPATPEPGCNSGIFIREFGATKEITKEEWSHYNAYRDA